MTFSYKLRDDGQVCESCGVPNIPGYLSGEEYPDGVPCGDYIINGKQYTPPDSISVPSIAKDGTVTWVIDTAAQIAQNNAAIKVQLADLDTQSARSLRSVTAASASGKTPDPADVAKLAAHEAQASALRSQLK